MSKQVQRRRGSTSDHSSFTGAVGELTVDTTTSQVVVHDGVTAGGHPAALASSITDHIADTTAAHAASAISYAGGTGMSATDVEAAIDELATEKLDASSYTAADVLTKILTVDGSGSGLDADLLDGSSSAAFAQNAFKTISVSGQSDVVADSPTDTLTLVAGNGIAITTDATADSVTVTADATGTNTGDQLVFKTIAVSGQSDVVADTTTDTLTFAAGSNMTITTNAATDTITFASSGGYSPGGTDVAIADGGTGQSTATLGFNALSPLTTRGDVLTRDATNNVRLALGASGTILSSNGTDAKFQTALTLGLPVKLASGTPGSVSSIDIVLSSYTSYNKLVLEYYGSPSATRALWLRTSTNGGSSYDSSSGDYMWIYESMISNSAVISAVNSNSDTKIVLMDTTSDGNYIYGNLELTGHKSTGQPVMISYYTKWMTATPRLQWARGTGCRNTAADVDAIRILPSSGNFGDWGYTLWGYA